MSLADKVRELRDEVDMENWEDMRREIESLVTESPNSSSWTYEISKPSRKLLVKLLAKEDFRIIEEILGEGNTVVFRFTLKD